MICDFWEDIKNEKRPLVIYGTGDAAEKLYYLLRERGVRVSAFVASSSFVRDRSFLGYRVLSLERAEEIFGRDMVLLLGFGSHKKEVISDILSLNNTFSLYMPDLLLDEDNEPITREYLRKNRKRIEWAYSLLSDEKSREVFSLSLEYRLSGRIEPLLKIETEEKDNWELLEVGEDECFLDCGAYRGDTLELFLSKAQGWERIILVEPDRKSCRRLQEKCQGMKNTEVWNLALSSKCGKGSFLDGRGRGSRIGEGESVGVVTIDSLLSGERASIIKFDIEGEEKNALKGGRKTIEAFKPKLYLSAYHRTDDFWSLLEKLWTIRDDYRVYMRKSPCLPLWDVDYILL